MEIKAIVNAILYENTENGFTVILLDDGTEYFRATANTVGLCKGMEIILEGEWITDSKYGKSFKASKWRENIPTKTESIIAYLGSGIFKGIGNALAKTIVDRFKEETLTIIDTHSSELLKVPMIGPKKAQQIWDIWDEHKNTRLAITYLLDNGISIAYAVKIVKRYGNETIDIVSKNPYRLVYDIDGIGFIKADEIAMKLGIEKEDDKRIKAGIIYLLTSSGEENGNTYMPYNDLVDNTSRLLEIDGHLVARQIDILCCDENKEIISSSGRIFLSKYYYAEKGIASRILGLIQQGNEFTANNFIDIEKIEKELGIEYEKEQTDAIHMALNSKVMVLTGGPGTGKTTVTNGIIRALQDKGYTVGCAAPTGKAAERMSESTGMEAKTIHRFLGYKPNLGYEYNEDNPLPFDTIIIDECSMINVLLMYSLMKAIKEDSKLILIGDTDQLPSIGAGNVLSDIINSDVVPVVKLDKIFRQAQSSRIITNAHKINKGIMPDLSNNGSKDFFFIQSNDGENTANTVVDLITRRLPNAYGVKAIDIQLLTPMKRGTIGTITLNGRLQSVINPNGESLMYGSTAFKVGDKVMQIKNNYDKEVFNGDGGIITNIDKEAKSITVRFKSNIVTYSQNEFDELILAYASTIHKSQGSEYDIVVIPILREQYVMLQRNLLYTAITRAKKICVIVGEKEMIEYCVKNVVIDKRLTTLREKLENGVCK